jgi:hypothetical protein
MKMVVSEPLAEYKTTGWRTKPKGFSSDDSISSIENGEVTFFQPNGLIFIVYSENSKLKLSSLRGKMAKQGEGEIDDQLSNLRGEWERDI